MTDNVEQLERESAERRRSDILYNGLWKWILVFAILASIADLDMAISYFYIKSHQERELVYLLNSCAAILMPWIAAGLTYKGVKARILSSGSSELLPAFRYSCVLGLLITSLALEMVLHLCGVTR